MSRRRALAWLGSGAILLSGCSTSVSSGHSSLRSPGAAATADARALLSAARLPPGAVKISTKVPAASSMGATTLVDLHHSYAVPTISSGTSLTPPNAQLTGTGTSNGGLRKTYTVSFPSTSVLQTRQLLYGFWTRAGGGYTMRVDAQVVWIPSKPATAVVAPGAIEIQVRTIDSGTFVRVTKANVIDAITRTVNALRMRVPGAASCAAERSGTTLKVSFFHATRGQPYATAILQGSGCLIGTVTQYRPSGSVVTVGGLDAGGSAQHVAKLVGISLDT